MGSIDAYDEYREEQELIEWRLEPSVAEGMKVLEKMLAPHRFMQFTAKVDGEPVVFSMPLQEGDDNESAISRAEQEMEGREIYLISFQPEANGVILGNFQNA